MNEHLDRLYLNWLYSQVSSVKTRNPARTYWTLLRQLFKTEFVWFIPNDDNRAADGCDLRREFAHDLNLDDVDPDWMNVGCSMLEMLIGLSRRLSFEAEGRPRDWFWRLIENLGLDSYNDSAPYSEEAVAEVLNTVIYRTYDRRGRGGLFPLLRTGRDQRNVEIWYQLNAYLLQET